MSVDSVAFSFLADEEVEKFASQLELIIKGDVVGAKRLDSFLPSEASLPEDSDGSSESCSTIHSGAQFSNIEQSKQSEYLSPGYAGLSNAAIRSNLIKQQTIEGLFGGAFEELIDAEDATKPTSKKESATNRNLKEHQKLQHQFTSQKDALSSQLLPSEAMDILKLLWKDEARLCSLICDIQQQGVGKKKAGHSMFFLNTVLVPPINQGRRLSFIPKQNLEFGLFGFSNIMTSQRGRGRPPKSSYKNPNRQSPVNNFPSTASNFPQHIPRKSRTVTKTNIAVKTWSRRGSDDSVETQPSWVVEKVSSLPQWITKKTTDPKSNGESRNMSRASKNEFGPCSSLSESSLVPWMAEIEIPGPIPDFDSFNEVGFFKDFFVGMPED
ncbi:hypothetical protein OIU77_029804 [Salix suchowensis]|uniref:Uncharacterized protein n=1 Tax=Salix suchowensis TaxID=1278906 RepID=A0ABQ9BA46_9ROSI|nr:hypothetical protein OIU77_029804 [Salix suchowensis]